MCDVLEEALWHQQRAILPVCTGVCTTNPGKGEFQRLDAVLFGGGGRVGAISFNQRSNRSGPTLTLPPLPTAEEMINPCLIHLHLVFSMGDLTSDLAAGGDEAEHLRGPLVANQLAGVNRAGMGRREVLPQHQA